MSSFSNLVDLSHPWRVSLWPFIGLPNAAISDINGSATRSPRVQQIITSMHIGTHLDAPVHFITGAGDMASLPLDQLVHEGAIVDVSDKVKDWDILYPEHITSKVDVKEGDVLIIHYGWHHYYSGEREENQEKYFFRSPGGDGELAKWMLKKKIRWFGVDAGSPDHPMNMAPTRKARPDLVKEYEKKVGKNIDDIFPPEGLSILHTMLFPHNIVHAENVGGEVDKVLNRRCTIGAFPWNFIGGDASICRIIAFQ